MTSLVDEVEKRIKSTCIVMRISRSGCSASLSGAPQPRKIVDLDNEDAPIKQNQTRCDYLFFAGSSDGSGWVVPLELKKGRLKTSEVVRQLRAGAQVAERLVPKGMDFKFRPVAIVGSRHKAEILRLRDSSNQVEFHRKRETVRLLKSNAPLMDALNA